MKLQQLGTKIIPCDPLTHEIDNQLEFEIGTHAELDRIGAHELLDRPDPFGSQTIGDVCVDALQVDQLVARFFRMILNRKTAQRDYAQDVIDLRQRKRTDGKCNERGCAGGCGDARYRLSHWRRDQQAQAI